MQKNKTHSPLPIVLFQKRKNKVSFYCFGGFAFFFLFFHTLTTHYAWAETSTSLQTSVQTQNIPIEAPEMVATEIDLSLQNSQELSDEIRQETQQNTTQEVSQATAYTQPPNNVENDTLKQELTHSEQANQELTSEVIENQKITTEVIENSASNFAPARDFAQNSEFGWSKYLQAIGTMIFLLIILWYILKLVRRYGEGRFLPNQKLLPKNSMYLEGQLSLGPNKCLTIINVLGRRLVLGVTEKDITFLTELYEENNIKPHEHQPNITDNYQQNHTSSQKSVSPFPQPTNKTEQDIAQHTQTFQEHLNAEVTGVKIQAPEKNTLKKDLKVQINPTNTTHINTTTPLTQTAQSLQTEHSTRMSMSQPTHTTATISQKTMEQVQNIDKKSSLSHTQKILQNQTVETSELSYDKRASRLLNAFKRNGKIQ